jgi:hypothetical protein
MITFKLHNRLNKFNQLQIFKILLINIIESENDVTTLIQKIA